MTDTVPAVQPPTVTAPPGPARSFPRWLPGWWPLAVCTVLGMAGGTAYGVLTPPRYTATSYVLVVPERTADPAGALGYAQAYGRVATGTAVLAEAQAAARLPVSGLQSRIRSATSPDAPMIEVTGVHRRPDRAATITNAVAEALADHGNASAKNTGMRLTVFSEALAPAAPSSPSPRLTTAVGAGAGVLVGGLALLVRPGGRRERDASARPAPPRQGAAPEAQEAREVQGSQEAREAPQAQEAKDGVR
ncbi:lipopolysaccharide biosynthesis protein [Streptomyces sp. URMC 123]|uniref:lipopolysaccharide biosynthesis protein n=1 Tax=Streptomyces sp. URMC 123 TaxID=3423403 RepID=UPI003F1BF783